MTHFLARLVGHARGPTPRVVPIIPSRFAPTSGAGSEMVGEGLAREMPGGRAPAVFDAAPVPIPPIQSDRGDSSGRVASLRRELPPRPTERSDSSDALIETGPDLVAAQFRPKERARMDRTGSRVAVAPNSPRETDHIHSAEDTNAEPPVVRVTIGRIEVRAGPAPVTPPRRTARAAEPALTLDAYLKSRVEGGR